MDLYPGFRGFNDTVQCVLQLCLERIAHKFYQSVPVVIKQERENFEKSTQHECVMTTVCVAIMPRLDCTCKFYWSEIELRKLA